MVKGNSITGNFDIFTTSFFILLTKLVKNKYMFYNDDLVFLRGCESTCEKKSQKVWNNLKRCAFQCIKSLKIGFCEEQKVWNQIKIWTLTSLYSGRVILIARKWKLKNWREKKLTVASGKEMSHTTEDFLLLFRTEMIHQWKYPVII